jgi:penicillin amidase
LKKSKSTIKELARKVKRNHCHISVPESKMKIVHKILLILLILIPAGWLGGVMYLYTLQPVYSGRLTLIGLQAEVEVIFDTHAIPHIFARNEEDVYFALGYVHAQERLFQMEMIRRVASGRLAEILGKDLVETDRFFRTIGILESAERNVVHNFQTSSEPFQKAALAYLAGVNQFVEKGTTPIEFRILGIPKEKFAPKDIYLIGAMMAFGFASGFEMDPLVTKTYHRLGRQYLQDWVLDWHPDAEKIPVFPDPSPLATDALGAMIHRIVSNLPAPAWIGSNGWVMSGNKTKSGKVIFANDTHMMYSQPSVWYEAHLECPGFSFYGNHAAGFPFALIGHNRSLAWGLTMFENDDVDFYRERANPTNPNQVWVDDHWENLSIRKETLHVRDAQDVVFNVRTSRHGPILNDVDAVVRQTGGDPVAVWWSFNMFPTTTVQAFYGLAHAKDLDAARKAVSMIDAVGLNVMYGDRDGNVAWWAAAKLIRRPEHVNSKLFLDGASGKDEPLGYYDFSDNPHSVNPPEGFVYSANNQPDTITDRLYPGYYVPEDRARRIMDYLNSMTVWTVEAMKKMSIDCTSPVLPEVTGEIMRTLKGNEVLTRTPNHATAYRILQNWNGDHQITDVAPTLYYTLLSNIMENTFADELGQADFEAMVSSHLMKRTVAVFVKNDPSLWWDNIHTKDVRETRRMIFADCFDRTLTDLEKQLGSDVSAWHWGKVHTLEHGHLIGRQKPLDRIFNVGPYPAMGGNEVIVNLGFRLSSTARYPVTFGPAMRIIIDFADIENSVSVNPTGQSGCLLSAHYADQTELFNTGKFRKQMMNLKEIRETQKGTLILRPE